MKKSLVVMFILVLIASLALLAGCSDGDDSGNENGNGNGDVAVGEAEEQAQVTEDGERKITVEEPQDGEESDTVTIEGEQGEQSTIEVQEQAPSEEALGAPIYPGSQYVEGSGVSGTTTSGDQQLTASGAEFTTSDTIGEVVSWYTGIMGEPMVTSPEETDWMFQDQEGNIITIIVELFEGKTKITIAKVGGDIDINL